MLDLLRVSESFLFIFYIHYAFTFISEINILHLRTTDGAPSDESVNKDFVSADEDAIKDNDDNDDSDEVIPRPISRFDKDPYRGREQQGWSYQPQGMNTLGGSLHASPSCGMGLWCAAGAIDRRRGNTKLISA